MIATTDIKSDIINEFESFAQKSDSFNSIRKASIDTFNELGFPTTRHEEWKYTNVKNIVDNGLVFGKSALNNKLSKSIVETFLIGGKNLLVIVFENGIFNKSLSGNLNSIENLTIKNLASALNETNVQN